MAFGPDLCLLCRVGRERVALHVSEVLKVVAVTGLSRLPRLPVQVAGICHHRGRIVTVFDAGVLLLRAAPQAATGSEARIVVLDRLQRHLALVVDAVEEIEAVRLSADLPTGPTALVRVAEHRGQAVFGIDADALIAAMVAT